MPVPGAADDVVDVRKTRGPAEFALDFFGSGEKLRRVARPTFGDVRRNARAVHLFDFDDADGLDPVKPPISGVPVPGA